MSNQTHSGCNPERIGAFRLPIALVAFLLAASLTSGAEQPQLAITSMERILRNSESSQPDRLAEDHAFGEVLALPGGSVLLHDGGTPDYANGLNIVAYGIVDDFTLSSDAVIENVFLPITTGPDTFNGVVGFSIYTDDAGSVGVLVASVGATVVSTTGTGGTISGFPVVQLECRLDTPIVLTAGNYWLRPQLNNACSTSDAIYWETSANNGLVSLRHSDSNACAGPFPTLYSASASFQLYGYLGPYDPCRFGAPAPIITNCPENFVTACNTPGGYNPDYVPTVISECDTTFTVSPEGTLPYGTTLVTVTVQDSGGNTTQCFYYVEVTADLQDTFRKWSIPAEDGSVRAPTSDVSAPGPVFGTDTRSAVGDDARNLQNVMILSFDTSGLPDDAEVTDVSIRLVRASASGQSGALGGLVLDIGGPSMGGDIRLLANDYDFNSAAAHDIASSFPHPEGDGYTTLATVKSDFNSWINTEGRTQFRVRLFAQSDEDFVSDSISFHTGESSVPTRPELIVSYHTGTCFTFPVPPPPCSGMHEVVIYSNAFVDGAIGESHFTSEVGGQGNTGAGTAAVGDAAYGAQQIIFLHFDTSVIPPEATIDEAELRLLRTSAIGTPAESLGNLVVDMRNPYLSTKSWYFGTSPLTESIDFEAFAPFAEVAVIPIPAIDGPTTALLNAKGRLAIYKGVATQFRVRFQLGDDGDFQADQVTFAMGNYGAGSIWRPRLKVMYRLPCSESMATTGPSGENASTR